jgi:hypothetical protein
VYVCTGDDGEDGEDGEDGFHCDDFEVNIEFDSEDIKKGTHTFNIAVAGPKDKDEHEVTIDIKNTVFLIDGRGGRGGRG